MSRASLRRGNRERCFENPPVVRPHVVSRIRTPFKIAAGLAIGGSVAGGAAFYFYRKHEVKKAKAALEASSNDEVARIKADDGQDIVEEEAHTLFMLFDKILEGNNLPIRKPYTKPEAYTLLGDGLVMIKVAERGNVTGSMAFHDQRLYDELEAYFRVQEQTVRRIDEKFAAREESKQGRIDKVLGESSIKMQALEVQEAGIPLRAVCEGAAVGTYLTALFLIGYALWRLPRTLRKLREAIARALEKRAEIERAAAAPASAIAETGSSDTGSAQSATTTAPARDATMQADQTAGAAAIGNGELDRSRTVSAAPLDEAQTIAADSERARDEVERAREDAERTELVELLCTSLEELVGTSGRLVVEKLAPLLSTAELRSLVAKPKKTAAKAREHCAEIQEALAEAGIDMSVLFAGMNGNGDGHAEKELVGRAPSLDGKANGRAQGGVVAGAPGRNLWRMFGINTVKGLRPSQLTRILTAKGFEVRGGAGTGHLDVYYNGEPVRSPDGRQVEAVGHGVEVSPRVVQTVLERAAAFMIAKGYWPPDRE